MNQCTIGGVTITTESRAGITSRMLRDVQGGQGPVLVFDVNGHAISMRAQDEGYAEALGKADVVHADGGFIVTLSRWFGGAKIAERSATTDLLHDFAAAARLTGVRFYLLGGTEEVNSECADRLTALYPGLRIVGRRNGYFADHEEASVVRDINASQADVLWVGLGKPKEQLFSVRWKSELTVKWVVTCGGCFNYVTGEYPRAPEWMQRLNIEWVHRLGTNPRHLAWRYVTTVPHALWLVARAAFRA